MYRGDAGANTVLVDMDGVLADFEEPNNDIIRAHYPDITPIVDRRDFYFTDTYDAYEGVNDTIYIETRRAGFFRSLPLVDGAIEGWQQILELGYTPQVCSSPLEDHDTCEAEKVDWLEEHFVPVFGAWVVDTAVFDRDKSGYDAFAMIDDRPTLRNFDKAVWQHIVFSRSYNRAVETEFRLENWCDPALPDLLEKAREGYLLKG